MFKMFIKQYHSMFSLQSNTMFKKVATLASYPWLVNDAINRHFHVFFNF